MVQLKYYDRENKTYPVEYEFGLSQGSAYLLTNTLLYNYNILHMRIRFSLNGKVGNANWTRKIIKYHKYIPTTILVVIHEVAHIVDMKRDAWFKGKKRHTKKHAKIVKEMITICRKNKYFQLEKFDSGDSWNPNFK